MKTAGVTVGACNRCGKIAGGHCTECGGEVRRMGNRWLHVKRMSVPHAPRGWPFT